MLRKPDFNHLPIASVVPKRLRSLPLIWLVPILASVIGIWLGVQAFMASGPTVTLLFESAEGLEAGKTKIRYKSVDIGEVKSITLSKDRNSVIVTAELLKEASDFLVADTQFWIVKPRISGSEVSGIGTLFSGSYIALKVGDSHKHSNRFVGLETAPILTTKLAGKRFQLTAQDLGSLEVGSPIYFRHIRVGEVISYRMGDEGKELLIDIFVHAPYDRYVTNDSRFWNASGIEATMDSKGVEVKTESLISILTGGITFETPSSMADSVSADADQNFTLFKNRLSALKTPEGDPQFYQLNFNESLRGLSPGATVEFQGIPIGEVVSVAIKYNPDTQDFDFPVIVAIYEDELGLPDEHMTTDEAIQKRTQIIERMIARGMRAQLRSGNLLTGQLYIALAFFPDAPATKINWNTKPIIIPTIQGTAEILQLSVTNILKKVEKMPLDEIGVQTRNAIVSLNESSRNLNLFIQHLNKEIAPETQGAIVELRKTLLELNQTLAPDSPLQRDLRQTLRETTRSVQTFRTLADTLEGEPESLLQGKKSGDTP